MEAIDPSYDYENLDIYIGTIKPIGDFENIKPYKQLMLGESGQSCSGLTDSSGINISYLNKSLCEFTGMYWVAQNHLTKPYVGFCQYRRLFPYKLLKSGLMCKAVDQRGIIIANKTTFKTKTILGQYESFHNVNDLLKIGECIKERYEEYYDDFVKFVNGNEMYSNNCFIMKREDFLKYVKFVWGVISLFLEKEGIRSYEDCVKKVNDDKIWYCKKIKNFSQNGTMEYQARFLAYLAERLTTIYVKHNFENPFELDTVMIEKKYDIEKD